MRTVWVKKRFKMTHQTFTALKAQGFNIILMKSTRSNFRNDIVWNWGWGGGHPIYAFKLLNRPRYIPETTVVGVMRKFRDIMPQVSMDPYDITSEYIIGKNNGHKGNGKLVMLRSEIQHGYQVYQEFIEPPRKEYRVIIVGNQIPIIYRKNIEDPFNPQIDKPFRCCEGPKYGIKNKVKPPHPSVLEVANTIIERTDLDILGVDILEKDGHSYLIETNSAPGIGPTTAKCIWESIQSQWGR